MIHLAYICCTFEGFVTIQQFSASLTIPGLWMNMNMILDSPTQFAAKSMTRLPMRELDIRYLKLYLQLISHRSLPLDRRWIQRDTLIPLELDNPILMEHPSNFMPDHRHRHLPPSRTHIFPLFVCSRGNSGRKANMPVQHIPGPKYQMERNMPPPE